MTESNPSERLDESGPTVSARGHANVTARHASTFEVTTDDSLTPAGDCIIGVDADVVPADFPDSFRTACRARDASITVSIEAHNGAGEVLASERVSGYGHPDLAFTNNRSMVFRTSEYIDDRTVMIGAGRAAADLDRDLIAALAGGADLRVGLRVA